jgi:hypothetical protein
VARNANLKLDEHYGVNIMKTENKQGGKREGAGRPAVSDKAKSRTVRLNDADYKKFQSLGGANWLRYELSQPKER